MPKDTTPVAPALIRHALITGDATSETIFGTGSLDIIDGGAGNDVILGRGGVDLILGNTGNDTLDGEDGADTLVGGDGDDTFILSEGGDAIFGGLAENTPTIAAGRDILDMSDAFDTDTGAGLTVTFTGVGTGDVVFSGRTQFYGLEGVIGTIRGDTLIGADGDDILQGGRGQDLLDGGAGNDDLSGGVDADTLLAGTGNDTFDGGSGNDVLSGAGLDQEMTVVLAAAGAGELTLGDGSRSVFVNIETIVGSDGNDTFTGAGGNDVFEGGLGDDLIDGGGGTNIAILPGTLADATVYLRDDGSLRILSAAGDDVLIDIDTVRFDDIDLPISALTLIAAPEPDDLGEPGTSVPEGDTTPLEGVRAPVGEAIESRADPAIGDTLFVDGFDVPLSSIEYVGDPDAIGLLPDGYAITDGTITVGIDNGIFLTTGGGPGTSNTEGGFSTSLGTPGDPLLDSVVQGAFENAGDTNDAAVLTFTFDSADLNGLPTLAFNLFFGSDEYPEFADSSFVDIAAVFVNGQNYALFNNDPGQPLSIVGESINTPGNFFSNGNDTFDTEYDGFSTLLTVLAPVQEGINTVTIGIADTGDSALDSGIFVGNLAGSDVLSTGSFVNVFGTDDDDIFRLNAAPQLVYLNGGRDVVLTSVANIDNDVIYGWGDNDRLILNQPLEPGAFSVTFEDTLAVLEIDSDGDGDVDSTTIFYGRFEEATFLSTIDGSATVVQTVGVLPDPPVIDSGTDESDVLSGGTGDDQLSGGLGDDTLDGGEGTDRLAGGAGNDVIEGDFGADRIGGGLGDDFIDAGTGADEVGGGAGNDTIFGGDGADLIAGGAGNDSLDGNFGNDRIGASFGDDYVYGGAGNDNMGGGTGRDTMFAGEGDDLVGAGEGDDVVYGVAGNNFLAGGGRNDLILGGSGSDTINGGQGDDTLAGGQGDDVFVFSGQRAEEVDVVLDFEVGQDQMRLLGYSGNVGTIGFEDIEYEGQAAVEMTLGSYTIVVAGLSVSQFDTGDITFF